LPIALLEERRTVAALQGRKIEAGDLELADIKAKEDVDNSDYIPTTSTTKGANRGRGHGMGRGKGRGQTLKANLESSSDEVGGPLKKEGEGEMDEGSNEDVEPQVPLPHPQDAYGWDDDQRDADKDEPLIRPGARSTTSGRHSSRLDAPAGGALDLIDRVSKAAKHQDADPRPQPIRALKQEYTDSSDSALLLRKHDVDTDSPQEESSSSSTKRKRQRSTSSDSPSTTDVVLPRLRSRLPVFSM